MCQLHIILHLNIFNFALAEVTSMVFDMGNILDAIPPPKLSDDVKTIGEALDQFDSILSTSYEYDKLTHGFGPGAALILKVKDFGNAKFEPRIGRS